MEKINVGPEVHINALKRELEMLNNGSHVKCTIESKEDVQKYKEKVEKELSELESKE